MISSNIRTMDTVFVSQLYRHQQQWDQSKLLKLCPSFLRREIKVITATSFIGSMCKLNKMMYLNGLA